MSRLEGAVVVETQLFLGATDAAGPPKSLKDQGLVPERDVILKPVLLLARKAGPTTPLLLILRDGVPSTRSASCSTTPSRCASRCQVVTSKSVWNRRRPAGNQGWSIHSNSCSLGNTVMATTLSS